MNPELKEFIKSRYEYEGFAFDDNKDIYANYASQVFQVPYEDCLEFVNGVVNADHNGPLRRRMVKLYFIKLWEMSQGNIDHVG